MLGEPRLDPREPPKPGARFAYDADVDVRPAIELAKVRGLEVKRPVLPTPEKDPVEAHLDELRQRQAQLLEEESGVAAARGHIAVIDYAGTIDGQPFEGSSSREAQIEIGAGRTFGGFEDAAGRAWRSAASAASTCRCRTTTRTRSCAGSPSTSR